VVDDATAERIRTLVSGKIDWSYVTELAEQHRVMPLLCKSLNEVCPTLVPDDVLNNLREYTKANARYNLYRTRELIILLTLFEASGIPALPFKGPVLSVMVYNNLGLRDYGDLDILVRQQDVLRAHRLLTERGYKLVTPSVQSHKEPHLSRRNKDLIFDSIDGAVRVELHWRLTGSHFDFPLDLDSLWESLEAVTLAGSTMRTLAPEDLLLYLCMHGSRHGWERLLWICDVAELLRTHYTMDWESITKKACELGSRRTLGLGLAITRDLLGLELPEQVWHRVQIEPSTEALAIRLRESLFQNTEGEKDISYWHDIHLSMRERPLDRLRLRLHYYHRYLRLGIVPNERDHSILELPAGLSFLYYVLRPFRLVRRFGLLELKKWTRGYVETVPDRGGDETFR
jgi:hypothetical protein